MKIQPATEAARYGNMARVASKFFVSTGALAELDAVYCYTRAAAGYGLDALYQQTCECQQCGDRYVADVADSLVFCPDCITHLSR